MRLTLVCILWLTLLGATVLKADTRQREARPIADLIQLGAKVGAATENVVWLETDRDIWMCVIEVNNRFYSTLKRRNVRELYANWPKSLCFNAGSFE
ncbi:MAG: hypothetical protein AAF293_11075 [Pseudomonadota bacterium]